MSQCSGHINPRRQISLFLLTRQFKLLWTWGITPPFTHGSNQKRVFLPFLTTFSNDSLNQLTQPRRCSFSTPHTFSHHHDHFLSVHCNSPYIPTNALDHILSFLTSICHLHVPNKAKFRAFKYVIPNPLSLLLLNIWSHLTQCIFLQSKFPSPQIILFLKIEIQWERLYLSKER